MQFVKKAYGIKIEYVYEDQDKIETALANWLILDHGLNGIVITGIAHVLKSYVETFFPKPSVSADHVHDNLMIGPSIRVQFINLEKTMAKNAAAIAGFDDDHQNR